MSKVVLLVELPGGDIAAVPFSSSEAAWQWEERHPNIEGISCRPVMTQRELASHLQEEARA